VHGNYIRESIEQAGLDPNELPSADKGAMNFSSGTSKPKTWKDIWGAGQGVGQIDEIMPVADIVERLKAEYQQARERLSLG